jgi:hypothetical protein
MTDHRMDGWARRLARSDSESIVSASGRGPSNGESVFDGVARALAAPVTRRRAVGLIGGAVIAGSLLRPGRARAQNCYPGGPQICTNPHGARVCVPNDLQCCSNENCAIACPYRWRDCNGPARCDDTARMCSDPEMDGYAPNRTKWCHQEVTVVNGCVEGGKSQAVRGWCCRPNEDCHLIREEFGTCLCPEDVQGRGPRDCDDKCCPVGQICVDTRAGRDCKPPCVKGRHYDENSRCVCDVGETCRNGCCPEGQACISGRCAKPTEPSGPFKDIMKSFGDFFGGSGSNSSAGGGAGGNYLRIGRAAAGPGTTPVRSALLLLGAVHAQGAAAAISFADHHVDRSYRRRVVAASPQLAKLAGSPGLDPAAANALDALIAAEAKAFAQLAAAATAIARSRGALRAHKLAQARKHARAAATFSSAAAKALRGLPTLRAKAAAALNAAGVPEVNVDPVDATEFQDAVRASGVPANITALLKGLGMKGDDIKRARQAFLAATPSGGPALIAPLIDAAGNRSITKLASELTKYARSVRRTPIQRSRVQPRSVPAPRARR